MALLGRSLQKEGLIFAFRNIDDDHSFDYFSDVSVNKIEFTFNELREKTELFNEFVMLNNNSIGTHRDLQVEDLYARQVKVKLTEFLRASLQLRDWLALRSGTKTIISDSQTITMLRYAFEFFGHEADNVNFTVSNSLTCIVHLNSCILRIASFFLALSGVFYGRKTYFVRENTGKPRVLVSLPNKIGGEFYSNYVKKLEGLFELVVLPLDSLEEELPNYVVRRTDRYVTLRNFKMLFGSLIGGVGLLRDYAIVQTNVRYFFAALNTVDYIFANEKISFLLNRQQVKMVNNALVLAAADRNIPVVAHVFEEVYYYDAVLLPSKDYASNCLMPNLVDKPSAMGMRAPLMATRFSDIKTLDGSYLRKVLDLDDARKVVLYASDPGALVMTPKQCASVDLFLMSYFAMHSGYTFVVKIHPSDDGLAMHRAYLRAGEPENILLVADSSRKARSATHFKVFSTFDFNSALVSCDAFLTSTSSSALQAAMLGVKTGIVDTVNHGLFRDLVVMEGAKLIFDSASLHNFLSAGVVNPPSCEVSGFYGLSNQQDTDFPQQLSELYSLIR